MVNRDSPIPLYYQLKVYFKDQMESGLLHPGDRLPTEMDLCEQFGISRAPVRQALTDLAKEGYVYRRPGRGTFVASSVPMRLARQTCIRVMTHYDVPWISYLEHAANIWNDEHPEQEIKLEFAVHPARDMFHRKLRGAVAKGEAPDLISLDYVWITHYTRTGYIKPLDEPVLSWLQEEVMALEPVVRENNLVDDKLYGLPSHADLTGLWYRRDYFDAEDLECPQTWDALLALIDHFNRPEVKRRLGHAYAIAFPVSSNVGEATFNVLVPFMWNAGATLGKDVNTIVLDNESVYRALRFLRKITFTRRAALPPHMDNLGWWDFAEMLGEGTVPMILGGTYEWAYIRSHTEWKTESEMAEHFAFAPVPRPSEDVAPVCSLGGSSWAIPRQSANPEVALALLREASSIHASKTYCEQDLQISPYRPVNRVLCKENHPWLQEVIPLLQYARLRPLLRNYPQISPFIQDMFYQVLWQGEEIKGSVQRTSQALDLLW
jgi:ABC-type glycerol-3-phosphate transport system substrate-binding protein/DNA-binding transcriptional regulator YhcF (GntR family)